MGNSYSRVKKGLRNPYRAASYLIDKSYRIPTITISSKFPIGTSIFDREWDTLIILDTCRVDALQALSNEYEFLTDISRIRSVGGTTFEWLAHTFSSDNGDELEDTAYLTPHGWAEKILDSGELPSGDNIPKGIDSLKRFGDYDIVHASEISKFERVARYLPKNVDLECAAQFLDSVPKEYTEGRTPPKFVTDRAIALNRSNNFERMILHYVQPHTPYLADAIAESRPLHQYEECPFEYIKRTGDRDSVWNSYLNELRWVLDDIEILLENIDSERVVISADHGEAFGEFGIFGHHTGSLHPQIRFVPWASTTATDSGSYEPQVTPIKSSNPMIEKNLRALGYL